MTVPKPPRPGRAGLLRRLTAAAGGAPALAWFLLPLAVVAATTVVPAGTDRPSAEGLPATSGHRHDTMLSPYSFVAALTPIGRDGRTVTPGGSGSARWTTVDLGAAATVAGVGYQPRPDGGPDDRIGRFSIGVSTDGTSFTTVATGTWADDVSRKSAQFAGVTARFVRLTAIPLAGRPSPQVTGAEVDVLQPASTDLGHLLDRTGWTASASDADGPGPGRVLDGDVTTAWRTSTGPAVAQPAWLALDLGRPTSVTGLVYLPPQDGTPTGRIGGYRVEVSDDGLAWRPVAAGGWADDSTQKTARFAPVVTRRVRLAALPEAGGRGPEAGAAEVNLLGGDGAAPGTTTLRAAPVSQTVTAAPGAAPAAAVAAVSSGVPGPLPHTGWVTTASDQETVQAYSPAAYAVDGASTTYWHSVWSGSPLPHWIQVDLGATHAVTALRYLPRQDGSPNGRVGRFSVDVSADGRTFTSVASGTWRDDSSAKTATFPQASARYVRLFAYTEAGNRGPWTSAAELDVLSPDSPVDPSRVGAWSGTTTFPLVPVAAVALPNNKLVLWSAYQANGWGGSNGYTQTAIYDLATGAVSPRTVTNTGHDMFCPGVAILPDGRILVTGGSNADRTSIYDPRTDTWSAGPPMTIARGYQGMTTLSTGQAFTVGGSWSGGTGGKTAEVWTPATGWRALSGVPADPISTADAKGTYRADNHAWLVAASGGRVFHAGPSRTMHWITTTATGSITSAGTRADAPDMMNGNAVYYDVNKVLTVGGSPNYDDSDATPRAYTVDFSGATPVTTRVGDLAARRAFANSVVLPDGQVLTIGGQPHAAVFTDTDAVMTPELWNPATGTWTTMAPMAVPRTYHSVALLLPDGRVFSGGGGLCGGCAVNHADGEIFTPPYLLNADGSPRSRPVVTSAPTSLTLGTSVTVTTDRPVSRFALVRLGSATHSVNSDQRRVPLTVTASSGTTATLAVPSDPGVALPGPWMLFAVDAAGTPSVAAMVTVVDPASPTAGSSASGTTLVSAASGKCLDDEAARTTPGARAIIWPCVAGAANQRWTATSGNALTTMGLCLDAKDGATAPGTPVILWTCVAGAANQQWTLRPDGSIQGVASGLCLDVVNGATANGTGTQLWPCVAGAANQRWTRA